MAGGGRDVVHEGHGHVHARAAVKALCVLDYLVMYGAGVGVTYSNNDTAIDLGLCTDLLFSATASANLAHVVAWHTRALHYVLSAGACLAVSPGHPVAGECCARKHAFDVFGHMCKRQNDAYKLTTNVLLLTPPVTSSSCSCTWRCKRGCRLRNGILPNSACRGRPTST
jgi:hypothetical protein